jgi:hypothetical protein
MNEAGLSPVLVAAAILSLGFVAASAKRVLRGRSEGALSGLSTREQVTLRLERWRIFALAGVLIGVPVMVLSMLLKLFVLALAVVALQLPLVVAVVVLSLILGFRRGVARS